MGRSIGLDMSGKIWVTTVSDLYVDFVLNIRGQIHTNQ